MAQILRKDLYCCRACQHSFSRYTKLQHHMASHTPEENMLYGDIFSSIWSNKEKKVKQINHKRKKLSCPICDKWYSHVGHYNKHLWDIHGIDNKANPMSRRDFFSISEKSTSVPKRGFSKINEKPTTVPKRDLSKINEQPTSVPKRDLLKVIEKPTSVSEIGLLKINEKSLTVPKRDLLSIDEKPTTVPKRAVLKTKCRRKCKGSIVNEDTALDEDRLVNIALSQTDLVRKSEKAHSGHINPVKSVKGRKVRSPPKYWSFDTKFKNKKYFECPVCKKKMTQSSTLTAHKRIHTGERPYQCPSCPMTFTFYQCLWNHSWCHKAQKSFPCDQCPKKFRYYQCLWTHYKVHTDRKLFACDVCKTRFATSSQLMYHIKQHPKYLTAKIKSCGARFLRTSDINEMPFKCEICGRSFRLKVSLISHKEKCHSFVSTMKHQVTFQKNKKCKKSSDISLTKSWIELVQDQQRGPGRPRKHAGLEVEKKVQKRGPSRPRKHAGLEEVERKIQRRSPGKPRKQVRIEVERKVQKRGPSRPRKHAGLEEVERKVQKRGPSRPRKCAGLEEMERKIQKGPGRPRKHAGLEEMERNVQKKGPGRPRKHAGLEKMESKIQKRGSCRPRKHAGLEEVERKVHKRGPGRPRKLAGQEMETKVQKRNPGRPRKHAGLKEMEIRVFSDIKGFKRPISKQHHTCSKCNNASMDCGCYAVSRGKKNVCSLSPIKISNENLTGQNKVYHTEHKNKTSFACNARIKDLPKIRSSEEKCSPKSSLRRSERLRGERMGLEKKHLEHQTAANYYKCKHCIRSYKSVSRLMRHQNLVHRNPQKKKSFVNSLQKNALRKNPSKKRTQRKCSCCGTVFVSYGDYKTHIAPVTCICGQEFQCGYIFCFHISTCGEHNAEREETVDQKADGKPLVLNTDENTRNLVCVSDDILPAQEGSESSLVFSDILSLVFDSNDPCSCSTTFDPYQAEGWCRQLSTNTLSSRDSTVTIAIDQESQNSSLEVVDYSLLVPEASGGPELNDKAKPSNKAGHQVQIYEKHVDVSQKCDYQCIVCNQVFSSSSELTNHSVNHVAALEN